MISIKLETDIDFGGTSVWYHVFDGEKVLALQLGSKVGSLLTDGDGDGVMIESPENSFSVDFLRSASFSLLQGCRMCNVKTEFVS